MDVLQALEDIVSSMDVLTLDVMMVCLAITAYAHSNGARSVTITPQDILSHKAISRRGSDLADLEQRIVQAMETLRVLKFICVNSSTAQNTRTAELRGDNLLIITKYTENEDDLSSGQPRNTYGHGPSCWGSGLTISCPIAAFIGCRA